MIDTNKLLGNKQPPNMQRGRNIVTIKRNLIKIDSLLKEKLVLFKVRNGIIQQEEENRRRRSREEDLEKLRVTDDDDGSRRQRNKSNNLLGGLIAGLIGLSALFLPQMIKLFNFLRRILSPITKMITTTLKALTSFLTFGKEMVDKVSASFDFKVLSKANIEKSFAKFSGAIDTFVNTLLTVAAFQALSNFPDLKSIKKFAKNLKNFRFKSNVTEAPIRGTFDDLAIEKLFKDNPIYQKLNYFEKSIVNPKNFKVNPKGRRISPEDGRFFAKRRVIPDPQEYKFDKAKNIGLLERFRSQDEVFAFFRRNELPSGTALRSEANVNYLRELAEIDELYVNGLIDDDLLRAGLFDINIRYDNTIKRIDDYAKEIFNFVETFDFDFRKIKKLKPKIPKSVFEKLNLINPVETIFNTARVGARNIKKLQAAGLQLSGQTSQSIEFGDFIKENVENIGQDVGAAARRFYPPGFEYKLIKPSMFEQGRSLLSQGVDFIKGIDETMVDLATKQTDKIASVITSGPLKGFTQSAKGMFRKAVGETIGLVPFLGDLIGLLLDIYLFGEIPERAGYKAVGGILGGFVGALIGSIPALVPFGGPFIGSILGGIGGDILGGIVYDIVKGQEKKVSAPVKPVKEVVKKTFGLGGYTGDDDAMKLAGLVHNREFVIDADSTLAVRQNAPGFLEDLNRAKGFESLEVLRNYASYEGTDTRIAHFIPIPLPIATNQGSSEVIIIGSEKKSNSIAGSHHDR